MPRRLRPTASLAPDAILVGDPGRALLLAQELLTQPKMSNHARGLWGYSGQTPAGKSLTIQATGMGAPSAAVVLADLAKLGVRRAVRIGTCAGLDEKAQAGELLLAVEAVATEGSAVSFGVASGSTVSPDPRLLAQLREELGGEAREARIASLDSLEPAAEMSAAGIAAADMQTVAVLSRGRQLGIASAAILVVSELGATNDRPAPAEAVEGAAKRAGAVAASIFST